MGIFSRLRDIINSNVNAMLDAAEDPEKLIRLMIQEMEDTLIEIKAQCAGAMAQSKSIERNIADATERTEDWERRAQLALEKGREDLAKEALLEKRHYLKRIEALEAERSECNRLIEQYKNDITQLEAKMTTVREKQRMLVQRHIHAQYKRRAEEHLRRADSADSVARFDSLEQRIDRMEAGADLVNFGRQSNVEKEFEMLEEDGELVQEMEELRKRMAKPSDEGPQTGA